MEIINNYQDPLTWNDFIKKNTSPSSFLQSWEWGEFNKKVLGLPVVRWALIDEQKLRICFTLIAKKLPFNQYYYYCPRGLVYDQNYSEKRAAAYKLLLNKLKSYDNAIFYRSIPPYEYKKYMISFLKRLGFIRPLILKHQKEPDYTSIINLAPDTEKLLQSMHPKTRYNIRLAEKKGVIVSLSTKKTLHEDFEYFYELLKQTSKRDKIKIYSKDYYYQLINFFSHSENELRLRLYIAKFNHQPLSAIIIIYFGDTATYLHGASSDQSRHLMPNYLTQWQAIKDAKNQGYKIYDFWGINDHDHRWQGITRFKKSFGGTSINYIGALDFIIKKKLYFILLIAKIIKKIIPC